MLSDIKRLDTLWKKATEKSTGKTYYRANKSTKLIVTSVDYNPKTMTGNLNNDHWAFQVPYGFRDALGLSYDQRFKNKTPYMIWVQSPYINFQDGDLIMSKNREVALSVKMSTPMSRANSAGIIDYGLVEFEILKREEDNKYHYKKMKMANQYEFLEILIKGLPESIFLE